LAAGYPFMSAAWPPRALPCLRRGCLLPGFVCYEASPPQCNGAYGVCQWSHLRCRVSATRHATCSGSVRMWCGCSLTGPQSSRFRQDCTRKAAGNKFLGSRHEVCRIGSPMGFARIELVLDYCGPCNRRRFHTHTHTHTHTGLEPRSLSINEFHTLAHTYRPCTFRELRPTGEVFGQKVGNTLLRRSQSRQTKSGALQKEH